MVYDTNKQKFEKMTQNLLIFV